MSELTRALAVMNPWLAPGAHEPPEVLPARYLRRFVSLPKRERGKVQLVVGPRQCGKTTLIWRTLLPRLPDVLYVNCDDALLAELIVSPALFVEAVRELVGARDVAVFLDEVQNLGDAGRFLKVLADLRAFAGLFASGSSSFHLESATRESLAGRARRTLLLPLSIREVAEVDDATPSFWKARARRDAVETMILSGSYPEVWLADSPERALAELVQSFVLRDASDRFRIKHLSAFRKILELAASQIGNLCNFAEWAQVAGVSATTVADYCQIIEDTFVARLVRPFLGGRRAEITSRPKPYFYDNGVRNTLFGGLAPLDLRGDRGALYENLVFAELARHLDPLLDTVSYWRTKGGAEVDFVVQRAGALLPIEAKLDLAAPRLTRSMRSFVDAYHPARFLVVTQGARERIRLAETEVVFLPVEELAEALR